MRSGQLRLCAPLASLVALALLAASCSDDASPAGTAGTAGNGGNGSEAQAEPGADATNGPAALGASAGADDADSAAQHDAASEAGDRPAEGPSAGEGGEILLLAWQPPALANPYLAGGEGDLLAASLVLEPLAELDPQGELIPVLAAEIPSRAAGSISADLTRITWTLRDDVVWSDGTPLSSADVEFTFAYCTALASSCAVDLSAVESVEAPSADKVAITFAEPQDRPFDVFVGHAQPIIQRAQFADCLRAGAEALAEAPADVASEACERHSLAPLGTGPFAITAFVPGDEVVYEMNPRYRGVSEGKPFFGSARLAGGGDARDAARSVLEIGEADYAWNVRVDPDALAEIEALGNGRVIASPDADAQALFSDRADPGIASAVHESITGVGGLNLFDSAFWNIEEWARR